MPVPTLRWCDGALVLIDQTRLPTEVVELSCRDVETVARAIETLQVRGAPAIGLAAAYGVVIGVGQGLEADDRGQAAVDAAIERLGQTRPTAVNLFWALDRMRQVADRCVASDNKELLAALLHEADALYEQDRRVCRQIGRHGADLLASGDKIITHCNAGGLATADYGTALGVVYAAQEADKKIIVFADETRPLLQGARLTAWELQQSGVEVRLICDNSAAAVMRQEQIDCAIVGADRIAANGDVANKIGTYGLAIMAREHGIPFYVAAPVSTLDLAVATGDQIPIEERRGEEISHGLGKQVAPIGVQVYNPAFDITPNRLVSAIITEKGVARPPFAPVLAQWGREEAA
ncbi:MAG: S-methyl-5-thioribose-1-phosphate isomerase [Candidatus Latescibacteria bacterium]|nr:S-methyl-5-thioribose-1-phosphate isomerase [Candidatus Latescibacterota bacterium]